MQANRTPSYIEIRRGFIEKEDFLKLNKLQIKRVNKHLLPRNANVGSLRQLDPQQQKNGHSFFVMKQILEWCLLIITSVECTKSWGLPVCSLIKPKVMTK